MPISAVLADSTRVGDAYFMAIGPAVIFLAVLTWVLVTLLASRKPPRPRRGTGGLPNRGPVQGGIIMGSPSQRSRRDPAPSVTHREVVAHVERARAEEAHAEEASARRGPRGRRKPGKRRFGLPKRH
ncbi:hypothetical protein [Actinomadura decatromicini]|uniref:Uncharacterized protein n=1 Tax=Actinomadura decatromicini TaxID=2604572 RepID=A0A5D3F753_9ACTN|nr:hypothetical protein [Actinomadura decatromicini]TYK43768.1 hypothetical protein FXF68_37135 [Actinomadura decatromicini]